MAVAQQAAGDKAIKMMKMTEQERAKRSGCEEEAESRQGDIYTEPKRSADLE